MQQICHYLDNVTYEKPDYPRSILGHMRDLFSDFLETIEHRAADNVPTYDFHIIVNEWGIVNQDESGTYVAYFMEHFLGYKDIMPLSHDHERSLFKALMCSRLVLTDLNLIRDDILRRVTDLNAKKTSLIKSLEKRRKKALNKNDDKDDGNNKKLMKRRKSVARTKRPASKKN